MADEGLKIKKRGEDAIHRMDTLRTEMARIQAPKRERLAQVLKLFEKHRERMLKNEDTLFKQFHDQRSANEVIDAYRPTSPSRKARKPELVPTQTDLFR